MEEKKHTEIKEVAFESQAVFDDMADSEGAGVGNPKNIQRNYLPYSCLIMMAEWFHFTPYLIN
jgi:hypothetical protein